MDFKGFKEPVIIESYSYDHLPAKYQIPHQNPLCVPGILSFQQLPTSTYREIRVLNQFKKLLKKGTVSGAQIDAALQGLSRFTDEMKDGTGPIQPTQPGMYIGDQTGCGKSRIAALIIVELFYRKLISKALWVSANMELAKDAQHELKELKCHKLKPPPKFLKFTGKACSKSVKKLLEAGEPNSIIFTAYSVLRSGGQQYQNLIALADWMEKDYSGIIVFDECHLARNASKTSIVVKWLHYKFPLAKILYLTATVGSEPTHLSYMSRLGLWGEGCPFSDVYDFNEKMSLRGISAMELIAIYLKSKGSFVARQLDVSTVQFIPRTMNLSLEQKGIYNRCVLLWQGVYLYLKTFDRAELKEQAIDFKAYWGSHLRFFDALLLTFKATEIQNIRNEYPKDQYSIVIALQNTGQEAFSRLTNEEKQCKAFSLCGAMLKELFVHLGIEFPKSGQVDMKKLEHMDDTRTRLVQMYFTVVDDLGRNPIDSIIWGLGGFKQCAEITGRSSRQSGFGPNDKLVKRNEPKYENRTDESSSDSTDERSSDSVDSNDSSSDSVDSNDSSSDSESDEKLDVKFPSNFKISNKKIDCLDEVEAFMNGEKRAVVLSQKGSTGISLHADCRCSNQTQRVQVCMQPPWTPESAVQQLGRTNRSGQVTAPIYILMTTDVPGEQRFYTSFLERLAKMGAMCHGERRATYNISDTSRHPLSESPVTATLAAQFLVQELIAEKKNPELIQELSSVGLMNAKGFSGDINQLLNRALGMKLEIQEVIYDLLLDKYDALIRGYIQRNMYDFGMMGVSEKWALTIIGDKVFGKGSNSCTMHKIVADRGVSWKCLQTAVASFKTREKGPLYMYNGKNIVCCFEANIVRQENRPPIVKTYYVYNPWNCDMPEQYSRKFSNWKILDATLDVDTIQMMWETKYNEGALPNTCIHKFVSLKCKERKCSEESRKFYVYVLRGCLLTIWDKVASVFTPKGKEPATAMKTIRVSAYHIRKEGKEKFVGLYVPANMQMAVQTALSLHYASTEDVAAKERRSKWARSMLKMEVASVNDYWKAHNSKSDLWMDSSDDECVHDEESNESYEISDNEFGESANEESDNETSDNSMEEGSTDNGSSSENEYSGPVEKKSKLS